MLFLEFVDLLIQVFGYLLIKVVDLLPLFELLLDLLHVQALVNVLEFKLLAIDFVGHFHASGELVLIGLDKLDFGHLNLKVEIIQLVLQANVALFALLNWIHLRKYVLAEEHTLGAARVLLLRDVHLALGILDVDLEFFDLVAVEDG